MTPLEEVIRNQEKEILRLNEENKRLQEQVDRIATLHVHNRFGFDPFERHARPLI